MKNYYTLTENGAIQFATTGSKNLDLFASIGSAREMANNQPSILKSQFKEAFIENPVNAITTLFWCRAVRLGAGERKIFNTLIKYFCKNYPAFIRDNLSTIVELGRWKDLVDIYEYATVELKCSIIDFWADAISKKDALACKWLPKKHAIYNLVKEVLNLTNKQMRKLIAANSKTVEQDMCAKKWSNIDYSKIPSQALNKYGNSFICNDKEHYLRDITTKKINAGAIYPHEVLSKYPLFYPFDSNITINETSEALWKALPNFLDPNMRFITVCDCSGSMNCDVGKYTAMGIARALSIYCAEKLEGDWKNKSILFSSIPEFIDCSNCKTLAEKNKKYANFDDCSHTNIEAVFDLILKAAETCADKSTIPNTILILSDTQFDKACTKNSCTFMESMRAKYKLAGIEFPSIIYWNLYSTNTGFMDSKYDNVAFASGFNPKILEAIFKGMKVEYESNKEKKVMINPIDVMNKALDPIAKLLKFDGLKVSIPEFIKDVQINTTIGQSIRNMVPEVQEKVSFVDCVKSLN